MSRLATGSKPFITKEWVDYRLNLLEKYCHPSVINQNCTNFRWLVVSSKRNLNKEHIDRLNKMEKIENIILDDGEGFKGRMISFCNSISHNIQTFITTRLDCDDIIHKYFIYDIQKNCTFDEPEYVLNFSTGYEYNTERKLLTIRSRPDTNMFSTLVERNTDNIKTVLDKQHHRLIAHFPVHQLNINKPMWIQLIHENNICTKNNCSPKVVDKKSVNFQKDFNVTI